MNIEGGNIEYNGHYGYWPVYHSSISRIDFLGINFLGFEFLETWMKSRDSFLGMKFLRLELHMSIKSQFFMATYAINFLTILQPRCVEMHFMYNFKTTLKLKYWVPPLQFWMFFEGFPFFPSKHFTYIGSWSIQWASPQ